MEDLRNASPREILHHITTECVSQDVAKKCKYVILGRPGSTGKTWLTNRLKELGYDAVEISEDVLAHVDYRDNYNHIIVNPFSTRMTIILNKPYVKYFPTIQPAIFATAESAYRTLGILNDIIDQYGCITVRDYCRNTCHSYSAMDDDYGWSSTSGFEIEKIDFRDNFEKTIVRYKLIPTKPIVLV